MIVAGSEARREREARKLLTWLLKAEARDGNPGERPQASDDVVDYCVERDLIERKAGRIKLSDAGRAWLRRLEAEDDQFRHQHQLRSTELREIEGTRRPVMVNDAESPLGWLRKRKDRNGSPLISAVQFEAGERLRADYWFAQLSPRVTANWSALAPTDRSRRAAPAAAASLRDDVIAAKARVTAALASVGPELASVLIDVCCDLKGLEQAEKDHGWPQRAGKIVLQLALTGLARHYGLLVEHAAVDGGARRIRHWGSVDYRPSLEAWQEPNDQ